MGLTDIKKELNKLDKSQIINMIAELYRKNKWVSAWVHVAKLAEIRGI